MATSNSVEVKQEVVDFVDIESKVIELCKENPKGITDSIIQTSIAGISAQQRVKAINRLLSTVYSRFVFLVPTTNQTYVLFFA